MTNSAPSQGVSHLGVIMDGNRRWATQQGRPAYEGHYAGYETARNIIEHCFSHTSVKTLTLYTLSTENWKRSAEEVSVFMTLLRQAIEEQAEAMHKKNIALRVLGDINAFPPDLQDMMHAAMEKTKNNTAGTLNLALNYGGREEILQAVKGLLAEGVNPEKVNEDLFSSRLYTAGIPDPDMIIRTSGEQRLSNFLLWQGAYSELYFITKLWPDMTPEDIDAALEEFAVRERRFGS